MVMRFKMYIIEFIQQWTGARCFQVGKVIQLYCELIHCLIEKTLILMRCLIGMVKYQKYETELFNNSPIDITH